MPKEFPVTIYHNPACGTSRNALATIREAGIEPTVVEYLKTGWERGQLQQLLKAMGVKARDVLRTKGDLVEQLGLKAPGTTDAAVFEAMLQHPVLVERPIVVTPRGTKLCRPADLVRELLPK
jgi:arsenate reductase